MSNTICSNGGGNVKMGLEDIQHLALNYADDEPDKLCSLVRKLTGLESANCTFPKLLDKKSVEKDSAIHEKIISAVDNVYKSIKEYDTPADLVILRKMLCICEKHALTLEKSKMHRNIGMYYFQSNRTSEAIEEFDKAIGLVADGKNVGLQLSYYSDLGLVYFYNNDLIKARHCYEMAEKLLAYTDVAGNILFLHNYRSGILYSNLHEYESARKYMEQSLAFAENKRDRGFATMNLGIIYKKQGNFDKTIECYKKALSIFEEDDNLSRSVVYNNLAELHKMYGQYEKALSYINLAFKNVGKNNLAKQFMYFNTYTEIKILIGEPEQAFDEFLELLSQVEDFHLHKSYVIAGINDMALLASEDGFMLGKLEATVAVLINKTGECDEEYKKELITCMNNISMYKHELKIQKNIFV